MLIIRGRIVAATIVDLHPRLIQLHNNTPVTPVPRGVRAVIADQVISRRILLKSLESRKARPPVSLASVTSVSCVVKLEFKALIVDCPEYADTPRRLAFCASPPATSACRPRMSMV